MLCLHFHHPYYQQLLQPLCAVSLIIKVVLDFFMKQYCGITMVLDSYYSQLLHVCKLVYEILKYV